MPLFFLLVGILLIVIGLNDRVSDLGSLIKDDFKPSDGSASFAIWIAVIVLLGLLGNVKNLKPVTNAFLLLVILVMVLTNKGFFDKFSSAIKGA